MKNTSTSAKSTLAKALLALGTAIAIITFLFWYTGHRKGQEQTEKRAAFFKQSVAPFVAANASANAKAVETLKSEIQALFEQYCQRVPKFTSDITGFGNKTKITWEAMKQLPSDDKDKVKRHVTEKFEMHVVSGKKMQEDLEILLKGFRRDIEANCNRMLVDIEAAVKADSLFSAQGVKLQENFGKEIDAKISEISLQAGKDAVVLSGMTILVSAATEEAVRLLVAYALSEAGESLAASMAATAIASGGATAGGTAGGGAVGSSVGPAGTLIGVAAGFTVGLIVDCIMTTRMEAKLNDECRNCLTKVETSITNDPRGLIVTLNTAISKLEEVQGPVIKQQLQLLP